ncbi:1226_t:CDS:2 [Ambispora gerdemannii]|uniref:1226_t:CDS:1 n=1 Tax=Ambispora gerdemannii TaxID=144530 RepID=A0A9N9BN55_9GLOM|nr:1226_t:CDS:2 [Ambispora gerdemannii]
MTHLILKISNVLAYALVLFITLTGIADPENNRSHEDESEESLLYPAVWTFKIWYLIYGLLGGFVLYQFFPPANSVTVEAIKWYHVIASILLSSFVVVWHQRDFGTAEIVILLLLLITLARTYRNLGLYPASTIYDRLFIHYPFTIYVTCVGFATVINICALIPLMNDILPSIFAIAFIGIIGFYFIDHHYRKDAVISSTLVWGLAGIALNNHDEPEEKPILIAATVAGGVVFGGILKFWINRMHSWWRLRSASLDERAPLLP